MSQQEKSAGCIIVTGGVGNIGSEITRKLENEGYDLALLDIDREKLDAMEAELGTDGIRVMTEVADLRVPAEITAYVDAAVARFGQISGLVHVAGHSGHERVSHIEDVSDALWADMIDLNLTGTFNICRAVLPHMRRSGYGRIVNFSTGGWKGTESPVSGSRLPYVAAKAGVVGLTCQLAKDYAIEGISANVVCPGLVLGKKGSRIRDAWESNMTQEQIEKVFGLFPMNRPTEPEEVAETVSFLVSPGCGAVSGQIIYIDGARH